MPVLVDGNNLLHRLPPGRRSRDEVRRLTLELVRRERLRVTVVFDGPPPPGTPPGERLGRASIRYAGSRSADDVILASLPPGDAARQWVVVTDDRELGRRARGRGSEVRSLHDWQQRLPDAPAESDRDRQLSGDEVAEWERYFAGGPEEAG